MILPTNEIKEMEADNVKKQVTREGQQLAEKQKAHWVEILKIISMKEKEQKDQNLLIK